MVPRYGRTLSVQRMTNYKKSRRKPEKNRLALLAVAPLAGVGIQAASLRIHKIPRNMSSPTARKALRSLKWELGKKGVWSIPGSTAYFAPDTNKVVYPLGKTYTGLHEFGHATMKRNSVFAAARRMAIKPGLALFHSRTPLALLAGLASDDKYAPKSVALTSLALSSPVLAEEAIANMQAARAVRKAGGGVKGLGAAAKYLANMAPAYGSYAGAALGAAGLGWSVAKVKKWHSKSVRKRS